MPKADERSRGDRLGQEDGRGSARPFGFTLLAAVAAVGFVIMGRPVGQYLLGRRRRHGGLRRAPQANPAGPRRTA